MTLLHGEVNSELINDTAALEEDFKFTLAAYLIAANNQTFFGYSNNW